MKLEIIALHCITGVRDWLGLCMFKRKWAFSRGVRNHKIHMDDVFFVNKSRSTAPTIGRNDASLFYLSTFQDLRQFLLLMILLVIGLCTSLFLLFLVMMSSSGMEISASNSSFCVVRSPHLPVKILLLL